MLKLGHLAKRIIINVAKLTNYALSLINDKGQHKARIFKAILGYTQENYQSLLEQIQAQALDAEVVVKQSDQYGQHLQVDLNIIGGE